MQSGRSTRSIVPVFVAGMRMSAGQEQDAQQHHERVREVRRHVEERLDALR